MAITRTRPLHKTARGESVARRRPRDDSDPGAELYGPHNPYPGKRGKRAAQAQVAPATEREIAARVPRGATFRLQLVRCGKARCRKWHGPYWYAYWFAGGRTRSAYVGSDARLIGVLEQHGATLAKAGQVVQHLRERSAGRRP